VSPPTYPGSARGSDEAAGAAPVRGLLGPHLGASVEAGHFWESEIGVDRMPYLADHRVNGAVVFPAAAFCEMALSAIGDLTAAQSLSLDHLRFEQALVLPATGTRRVQVALTPGPGESWLVRISSQAPDAEAREWALHARGLARAEPGLAPTIEVPSSGLTASDEHYEAMAARGLEYGPAFRALQQVTSGADVVWGRVALPEGLSARGHRVHPSLLDAGLQLGVASLPGETAGRTWLPASIRRLRWLGDLPADRVLWARARPAAPGAADGSFLVDVALADDAGHVVVEVEGLELIRLEQRQEGRLVDAFHEPSWALEPRPEAAARRSTDAGAWLVLPDRRGVGARLAKALEHAGHIVRIGEPGDVADPVRLGSLLSSGTERERLRGVVHLGSLDAPSTETGGAGTLEVAQTFTCDGPLRIVQALAERAVSPPPRLWLVSAGAQAARPGEVPAIEQSPLWGLGRVAASEHPEFRCTLVDLSRDADEIDSLVRELEADGDEDQVALRGPERLVARLRPWSPAPTAEQARSAPVADRAFLAATSSPGILDGLGLREVIRRSGLARSRSGSRPPVSTS
jgi:acyl transferase domain-containing protein